MKRALILIALCIAGFNSYAQKVKYKDLYVLLRAKNYKDAASFLKSYVVNEPDHPNANYQMGLMLEHKIGELDMLKQSDEIVARADSAILYYDKAYTYITAKEIKKHDDDYYELFKRRNLRTGKFEVILSDVQLDIEDRKNTLINKKSDIKSINKKFNGAVENYEKARLSYLSFRELYKDELSLSMGAVDSTTTILKDMVLAYDSALANFKVYKNLKKSFENTASEIIISNESIDSFTEQALQQPDFYAQKVTFYNFSGWGNDQLEKIEDRSVFMDHLIQFDESLDDIAKKIAADSTDLSSEVFKRITLPILKELKTIDPESLTLTFLQYKISQLNYHSALMSWYTQYEDTLNVGLQLDNVEKLTSQLESMVRLEAKLHTADKEQFNLRYHRFFNARYGGIEPFFNYVNAQADLIKSEEETVISFLTSLEEKDRWGYWNEDTVSLELVNNPDLKYNVFYRDSLANRAVRIAGIVKLNDKNNLFFGVVPSSRLIDSLYFLPATIEISDLNSSELIVLGVEPSTDQMLYLIGAPKEEKFKLELVYLHQTNGIIWSSPITLAGSMPPEMSFIDNEILLTQGEIVTKYQLSDGKPVSGE